MKTNSKTKLESIREAIEELRKYADDIDNILIILEELTTEVQRIEAQAKKDEKFVDKPKEE